MWCCFSSFGLCFCLLLDCLLVWWFPLCRLRFRDLIFGDRIGLVDGFVLLVCAFFSTWIYCDTEFGVLDCFELQVLLTWF